jgi:hypothetical protein
MVSLISIAELLRKNAVDIPSITTEIEGAIEEARPAVYTIDGMGRYVKYKTPERVVSALWVVWNKRLEVQNEESDFPHIATLSEADIRPSYSLGPDDPLPIEWLKARESVESFNRAMEKHISSCEILLNYPREEFEYAFDLLDQVGWREDSLPDAVVKYDSNAPKIKWSQSSITNIKNTYLDVMLALAKHNSVKLEDTPYKTFENIVCKVRPTISRTTLEPIYKVLCDRSNDRKGKKR